MPKISILIPCYNAEDWIKNCVDSALNQSIKDKEVIVIDDGSSDSSVKILESYGDSIKLETSSNRGGNKTRNRLTELAQGQWLQFLDADDELLPNKIQNQLNATELDTDIVWSPIITRTHTKDSWNDTVLEPSPHLDIYSNWINWHFCQTNGPLWKASSLKNIGSWNESQPCCQDNELCLRAIKNQLKTSYYPIAESIYRQWSDNTVSKNNHLSLVENKTLLIEDMLTWLDENKYLTDHHKKLAGIACFQLARYLAAKDLKAGVKYAKSQQRKRIFNIHESVAPRNFIILSKIIGYKYSEHLASLLRK